MVSGSTGLLGGGGSGIPVGDWRWYVVAGVIGVIALGVAYWTSNNWLYLLGAGGYGVACWLAFKLGRM